MSATEDVEAPREDEPFIPAPEPQRESNGVRSFLKDPQVNLCINFVGLLFLVPSIVGIAIASQYDANTSVCNDGTQYTVNLAQFLYFGGGVHIAASIMDMMCYFMCVLVCKSRWGGSGYGIGTFLFVWTIIGLNMYNSQMSAQCKNTPIGKMILSWSVIPLCVIGAGLLAICIPFCKSVKQWTKTQI